MIIIFPPWFFHSEKPSPKAQFRRHIYKKLFLTSNIPRQFVSPSSVIPFLQQSDHRMVMCPRFLHFTTIQLNKGYVLFTSVFTSPSGLVQQPFTNPSSCYLSLGCTSCWRCKNRYAHKGLMSWHLSAWLTEDTRQKLLEGRTELWKSADPLKTVLRLSDLQQTSTIHDSVAAEWHQSLDHSVKLTEITKCQALS